MTEIIEGASVSIKTMADGTLRLTVDIEPRNAQAAFALFGAPGRAMALAALKDGSGAIPDAVIPASDKPKGGEWAKLAGMWCADPDFWLWIRPLYDREMGGDGKGFGDLQMGTDFSGLTEFCVHAMKFMVEIHSRRELDHDPEALARFKDRIRTPFMAWMREQGIQK